MSILDSLVNVSISISSPVAQVASFNTLLIVGSAPTTVPSGVTVPVVGKYTSMTEITAMGWTASEPVYKTASIAFNNGATDIFIALRQTVTVEDPDSGTSTNTQETVYATLTRALEYDGWYGFVISGASYSEISQDYTDASTGAPKFALDYHKMFGYVNDWTGTPSPAVADNIYCYGFATKYTGADGVHDASNLDLACAMMAKGFSYDPGSETWAYKSLTGVKTDTFTSSEITAIKAANLNYYIECAGRNITLDGKTTEGEWIDIVRFRDWLQYDIQRRVYGALVTNSKIPYTDAGITIIQNQIVASLKRGQNVGAIPFISFDDDGNEVPGFTVSVPSVASIPESVRATRVLSGVKFTARLAGAIHIVRITGTLTQ